ncbi:WYL domain-containing protein [Streptomyces sp. NPDC006990]|uniref:helix-turn-helix transcriptional regulator n=1 Tax=Streptomyces sp. NPDC006990 TaxID=3154481 RepID=UPI0034527337
MPKTSARLLAILSLLQARRDWPGRLLAERLAVSPRTVRRDIDRLRELGYPITTAKGPDGGYRLGSGTGLPPLLFDDDQAVALVLALQTATASGVCIEEAAVRALSTVRQIMPVRLRRRVDVLRVTAVDHPGVRTGSRVDPRLLVTLSDAVRACEVLRFAHTPVVPPQSAETAPVLRRVEPHHLVTWSGRWYLVGWDLDREDWRTFRVDRIDPRIPTGPRFTRRELPRGDVAAFVSERFQGTGGDQPCRGEVILHLPARAGSAYAPDGVVEELGPDRCRLILGAWSWPALAASFGRFDADFEVVGPTALQDACDLLARRYARAAIGGPGRPVQAGEATPCRPPPGNSPRVSASAIRAG